MSNILTVAYHVEGPTDVRFLGNVIQRTFDEIAYECEADIDVFPVVHIPSPRLGGIVEKVLHIAKEAINNGIQVLCVHADADADDDSDALVYRINPAFEAVMAAEGEICKNLVAVIPVHMSEAWMLADKEIFKEEIDTAKSDTDLGIARSPESIADPKQVIKDAIEVALETIPKKRRTLDISDIYQPLGQNIPLAALQQLASYAKFRQSVIEAFKKLNYLH